MCPLFLMKVNSLLQNPTANMNKLNYSIGFYCSKEAIPSLMRESIIDQKRKCIILNDKNAPRAFSLQRLSCDLGP